MTVLRCRNPSTDRHHRRRREIVDRIFASILFRAQDRAVWIGRAVRICDYRWRSSYFSVRDEASTRGVPFVLRAAKGCDLNWTGKGRARIGLVRKRAAKRDADPVRVFLVAIDY